MPFPVAAPCASGVMTDSKSTLVYGYSLGGGFDVMLVGGLFARAEYEYRRITTNFESKREHVRARVG